MATDTPQANAELKGFAHFRPAEIGEGESAQDPEPSVGLDGTAGKLSGATIKSVIMREALRAATTDEDRARVLDDPRPAAVIVQVPNRTWIGPMKQQLEGFGRNWSIVARSGESREHKPSVGNSDIANDLARGRTVVGLATDPGAHLPITLQSAADVRIVVDAPDGGLVGRAMRSFFTEKVVVPDDALAGLDLDDIVAAMRSGTTAGDAIDRMRRASHHRLAGDVTSGVPNLETAVEFGAAREFGMALAQDIIDYKIGKISWTEAMKGGCFFGLAGTGKSLLCASVAAAAKVPLLRFSAGSLFGKDSHLGTVMAAIKDCMNRAAAIGGPVVVVWEEVEAIAPRRDQLDARGRDFFTPIVNLLLLISDAGMTAGAGDAGLGRPEGIFLLATTNNVEFVEPAMLRANRLERAIEVKRPDVAGLENILRFHLGSDLADADIRGIAHSIEGATAAEAMAFVREARRVSRAAGRAMQFGDLEDATRDDDDHSESLAWRIAVHEGAHAVSTVVTGCGSLEYVTIRGSGISGGQTVVQPDETDLPTLQSIESDAITFLAAGAAEEAIVGSLSSGWARRKFSDLGRVSRQIAMLHATSGLMGNLLLRADNDEAALAAVRMDPVLRHAVESHMQRLHGRARELVERHRDRIIAVAKALIARRHLDAGDVVAILAAVPQNDENEDLQRPATLLRDVSLAEVEEPMRAEVAPG
jgi:cell division protease FtsH